MENYSTLSRDKTFRRKSGKIFLGIVISIVALYAVLFIVQNKFGGVTPGGESGSSYATIGSGARAWSDLLEANDFKVTRDRGSITLPTLAYDMEYEDENDLTLDRTTITAVVLNGALPEDELKNLNDFVISGGRLITDNPNVLEYILENKFTSISATGNKNSYVVKEVSGMENISEIQASGIGSIRFNQRDDALSLLSTNRNTDNEISVSQAAIFRVGSGDVISLLDTGIISNALLSQKDNALFSIRIAGGEDTEVVFLEGVHGLENSNGFAGMPTNWKVAIVGLFASFVIWACSQGRRFGVGENPHRDLGPRRIYFAYALSNALKKSKRTQHPQDKGPFHDNVS